MRLHIVGRVSVAVGRRNEGLRLLQVHSRLCYTSVVAPRGRTIPELHGLSGHRMWQRETIITTTRIVTDLAQGGRRYVQANPEDCRGCLEQRDGKPEERIKQRGSDIKRLSEPKLGSGLGDNSICKETNGKLLTTPSRLFKLLVPLTADNYKSAETTAVLVHSQQPLSYLERLLQTELGPIKTPDGQTRPPRISFIAQLLEDNSIRPPETKQLNREGAEAKADGLERDRSVEDCNIRQPTEQGHAPKQEAEDTYSPLQRTKKPEPDGTETRQFVRWVQTTEIGDFIRDAARAGEFIISIEGMPAGQGQIRVTVPSFEERTYFLRMRLRKVAGRIQKIAEIKHECDALAHRGAQRVAIGGFGLLASWWYIVYRLTFETDLGWDTMEPVTYLASLSTLMGGYLWFLYHNREISYRSALDFTINARQKKLYQLKGVDLHLWETLIDEGNALRREIKNIAAEYDTEWDERQDERDEKVMEALKERERDEKEQQNKRSDDKAPSGGG